MKQIKNKIKSIISSNLQNSRSWKTSKKILVIESDDWGSVRMPNKEVFQKALKFGIPVDRCPFNTYDTLASSTDFEALFEVLQSYKGVDGKTPIITANTIVANPDFTKIQDNHFEDYFFEPFQATLKRYYPNEDVFSCWKYGMDNNLFKPQLHGREHVYVKYWMKFLWDKSKETMFSFENNFFGLSTTITMEKRSSFLPAFDLFDIKEIDEQKFILEDAQRLFYDSFGFKSESFIAPNYTWNSTLEENLKTIGVTTIQGSKFQQEPNHGNIIKAKKHFTGEKNFLNQVFLTRNVEFEPSLNKNIDWKKNVLRQIENAFFWGAPAIISSHRLNFIGGLSERNRTDNLELLSGILKEVLRKWPHVEFMTSDELGREILKKQQ
jgi:hypothetical protein